MAVSNGFIRLDFQRMDPTEQHRQLSNYVQTMEQRRSVRAFSARPISLDVMESVIRTAGTAPSGANQQPWTYVLIQNPEVKRKIRLAAEAEEERLRASTSLKLEGKQSVLGDKSYIEEAPVLVALFKVNYGVHVMPDGRPKRVKHYYVHESAPISAGFFLSALQHVGLDSVVHAPFPELQTILGRPKNEAPLLLFAVGFAKSGYQAPQLIRRPLKDIVVGESPFAAAPYEAPPYTAIGPITDTEQLERAEAYYQFMKRRRNIRHFSQEDLDVHLIYQAIRAAASTPSRGNLQPYRFAVVSDPEQKHQIRERAEIEERKLYEERISDEWRDALAPLGTGPEKPHLTDAPHLIVCFRVIDEPSTADIVDQGILSGYGNPSLDAASMAVGVLIGGLHAAGVCTLTHTPSPMSFLRDLLGRPKNEIPIIVMPVGYPVVDCEVPNITKKPLSEILIRV